MDENQRRSLGQRVEKTRLRRGLNKEQAAREVEISSITLKRIEDGLTVRPDILARVLSYFDLPHPGDDAGLEVEPTKVDDVRQVIETADLPDDVRRDLLERLDRDARTAPQTPPPVKPRATGTEGR